MKTWNNNAQKLGTNENIRSGRAVDAYGFLYYPVIINAAAV